VPDNGERFFSQYITTTLPSIKSKPGEFGECLCHSCENATSTSTMSQQQQPLVLNDKANDNEQDRTNNNNVAAATPTTALTKRKMPAKNITRQPTERQQTQCDVAKMNYIQPSPNINATCSPQVFYMMPQLIPMQYQLPCFMPPIQTPCCDKYAEWLKRRMGRPPHHQLCPNR